MIALVLVLCARYQSAELKHDESRSHCGENLEQVHYFYTVENPIQTLQAARIHLITHVHLLVSFSRKNDIIV